MFKKNKKKKQLLNKLFFSLIRIKARALPTHSQCPVPITKMNWSERKGLSQQGRDRDTDRGNKKNGKKASSLLTIHLAQFQRGRGAKKERVELYNDP